MVAETVTDAVETAAGVVANDLVLPEIAFERSSAQLVVLINDDGHN